MFYRFNAHREGRGTGRQGRDKEAAADQAARRIASGILKVQRRWADLMKKWAEKLPGKWLRILVMVSFVASGSFFLSLIVPGGAWTGLLDHEGLPSGGWTKEYKMQDAGSRGDSLKKQLPAPGSGQGKH